MTFTQNGKQHITLIHGHQPADATLGAILTALAILALYSSINTLFSRPIAWTAATTAPAATGSTAPPVMPAAPAIPGAPANPEEAN